MAYQKFTPIQKGAAFALLLTVFKTRTFDAIEFSIEFRKAYEISIDWHEFSYWLDDLQQMGKIKAVRIAHDGMWRYRVEDLEKVTAGY